MWELDEIIDCLVANNQRATYGAVAGVLGVNPRNLMDEKIRNRTHRDSWIVSSITNANEGRLRGRPSGYEDHQIDPECLKQLLENQGDFIDNADDLRRRLDELDN